jgi:hypothetical protein
MTEPQAKPPSRPRWVWAILVAIVVILAAVAVTHLLFGNAMEGLHGALIAPDAVTRAVA